MGDVSVDLTRLKGIIHMDTTITSQDTTLTSYWDDAKTYYDNKLEVHATLPTGPTLYDDDAPHFIARLAAGWWNYWKTPADATIKGVTEIKKEIDNHLKARFSKRTEGTSNRVIAKTASNVTGFE